METRSVQNSTLNNIAHGAVYNQKSGNGFRVPRKRKLVPLAPAHSPIRKSLCGKPGVKSSKHTIDTLPVTCQQFKPNSQMEPGTEAAPLPDSYSDPTVEGKSCPEVGRCSR